jgi:hypothetical protein
VPRDEDEDRPRRRRREEEDEDDRPRRRKREDDEEAEDRPTRRRRRDDDDEEDDFEGYGRERRRRRRLPRETLQAIAGNQRAIIFCILGYLCLIPAIVLAPDDLRIFVAIPVVLLGLTATVFVFLLATKVYSTGTGVVFGILTLLPCIGLIMLLIINGKATSVLKDNGVEVGFLGASSSDI